MKAWLLSPILLLSIVFSNPLPTLAQNPNAFSINEKFGIETGSVYDIYQSRQGYMWFGTESGLLRFDGGNFRRYFHPDFGKEMTNVREDSSGKIFVQNLSGQLFRLEQDSLRVILDATEYGSGGIARYEFITGNSFFFYQAFQNEIHELSVDGEHLSTWKISDAREIKEVAFAAGRFWMLTTQLNNSEKKWSMRLQSLHRSTGKVRTLESKAVDNSVRMKSMNARLDGTGFTLLMSMADPKSPKFLRIDSTGIHPENYFEPEDPKEINKVGTLAGQVFAATKKGLLMKERNAWNRFFTDLSINTLGRDNEGNTWLGTVSQGLFLIPKLGARGQDLGQPILRDATFDEQGNLYCLRKNAQFALFPVDQTQEQKFAPFPTSGERLAYDPHTKAVYFDFRGTFFDCSSRRLQKGKQKGYFRDLRFIDKHLYLTVGGGLGKIARIDGEFISREESRRFGLKHFDNRTEIGNTSLEGSEIAVDPLEKGIYIRQANGLRYLSPDGEAFDVSENSERLIASALCDDPVEGVWAADMTGNVHHLSGGRIVKTISTGQEVRHLAIGAGQIAVVHPSEIEIVDLESGERKLVTRSQGLLPGKILAVHVGDGKLRIANPTRLQTFSLSTLEDEEVSVSVYLENVRLFGEEVEFRDNHEFSHGENQLEFYLRAIAYNSIGDHYFMYRLNEQSEWIRLEAKRPVVRFDRLAPGDYQLGIKACRPDGNCSGVKTIRFSIDRHYTRKWWFILSVGLAGALIIFLLLQFRIRSVRRQSRLEKESESLRKEAYKSKITAIRAQMNPHFMFNALNTIQEFIVTNESEVASEYLADFADLMRKYLDQSRQDEVSLAEELETMELYLKLEQLRFGGDFRYNIHCSPEVDPNTATLPVMLLQPFVENAIRHGLLHRQAEKKLQVLVDQEGKAGLKIVVEDNGIGREASAKMQAARKRKHRSFATSAIRDRIDLINQEGERRIELQYLDLQNDSGDATGTRVIVTIHPIS